MLFSAGSAQGQTGGETNQDLPAKASVQVFLTAIGKSSSSTMPTLSELSVSVDKQQAQVTTLRSAKDDALLFALVVDASSSDKSSTALIRKAAVQLFQGLSTNSNRGYLALFNLSVAISRQPVQVSEAQSVLEATKFGGATAVYDAIGKTCVEKLSRSGNVDTPRRVILLISDGEDNQSHITSSAAQAACEKEGVAVFALVVHSPLGGPRGEQFLRELSQNTGGVAVNVKNLTDGVAVLLRAIEDQWALTLVPARSLDHTMHMLSVKSMQEDVRFSVPSQIFIP